MCPQKRGKIIIQDGTLWLSDNNNTVELTPDNKTDNT